MAGRLDGKVAIVTGGTRGIGEAIATAFALQGAHVVIASRKEPGVMAAVERIEAVAPGQVSGRVCHIGRPEQIADLVSWTEEQVGLPTLLVNNAATNPYFGPLLATPAAAWDKTFEVNVRGYFEVTRQVAQRLVAAGSPGSIVNVTSVLGMVAAPFQGVYGMTKAAVISMTRTFALELGKAGIRVNAVAPGLVDTKFASALTSNEQMVRHFTDRTAMGRYAQPEEIAGAALFLASDESTYVTGQTLCVDGGFTSL